MVPVAKVAVICVSLSTVKELTAVPPIVTDEVPLKFVPVITTVPVFVHPLEGVKELMVGIPYTALVNCTLGRI